MEIKLSIYSLWQNCTAKWGYLSLFDVQFKRHVGYSLSSEIQDGRHEGGQNRGGRGTIFRDGNIDIRLLDILRITKK